MNNVLDDYDLETIEGMENIRNFLEARAKRELAYCKGFKKIFMKSNPAAVEEVQLKADEAARWYASAERALSNLRALLKERARNGN